MFCKGLRLTFWSRFPSNPIVRVLLGYLVVITTVITVLVAFLTPPLLIMKVGCGGGAYSNFSRPRGDPRGMKPLGSGAQDLAKLNFLGFRRE